MWSIKTHGYAGSYCLTNVAISSPNPSSSLVTNLRLATPIGTCKDVRGADQGTSGCSTTSTAFTNASAVRSTWGAFGPSQVGSREPTSPHSATRGRRRWAGLLPPWLPPDLGLAPIYYQIFRKKSGEPRKYFSATARFRFREISCGDPSHRPAGGDFGVGRLLHHRHRPSNDS
ncbi:hypothetical protein ZWY2020_019626 [Hordeum vulgare]|nr:hypothetical protein ZWY2020_019626 [Hordeum vulgare]